MTPVDVVILAAGLGVSGWCVWHCVRGVRAMRRGRTVSCCAPAGTGDTKEQLAQMRADLDELRPGDRPAAMPR